MKILTLLLLSIVFAKAFTAEELLLLSRREHEDAALIPQLEIFPKCRKISTRLSIEIPAVVKDAKTVMTTVKWLDGKFIIRESKIALDIVNYHMIWLITCDANSGRYKMWGRTNLTLKGEEPILGVTEYDGLYVGGDDTIIWSQVPRLGSKLHSITVSKLNEEGEHWITYSYSSGELTSIIEGVEEIVE